MIIQTLNPSRSALSAGSDIALTLGKNMEIPKYVLLKVLPPDATSHDQVTRPLRLEELESVVRADPELYWGENPRGPLPVKNSDGSVAVMKAWQGFSFTTAPGMHDFFICYEFADGICVHTEEVERVFRRCQQFAQVLGATAISC